jgi:predicted GNAT family acetyltransferase
MSQETSIISFVCTPETFKPITHDMVRWLDSDKDFYLMQAIEVEEGEPLSREEWESWQKECQFCAMVRDGKIISLAHAWKYSETAWEVAGVWTKEEFRCQGYARAVCSFVTSYILSCGRKATCSTRQNNVPMIKVAESLGFQRVSK